jgi:hypothetical protein
MSETDSPEPVAAREYARVMHLIPPQMEAHFLLYKQRIPDVV